MEGWHTYCLYRFMYMIKKIVLLVVLHLSMHSFSQVLYSERFNSLSLNTVTYTAASTVQTYYYADVPAAMVPINNGNLKADTLTGNYPFRAVGQKQKAWLAYRPANVADTFAVSTSWLSPIGTADAWLITPTINNITANSVLTWEAYAPDISNPDGYEVSVTTNTSAPPVTGDFVINNRVFVIAAEASGWVTHGVSLAAYAGQNIRIAFRNTSSDKYQLWLDDIIVKNVANGYDVAASSYDTYKYSTINSNTNIMASFKNNGSVPVTSMIANYKVDNGAVISETQNLSTPLNYLGVGQIVFSTLFSAGIPAYSTVKIWVSSINGQPDQFSLNDTVTGSLTLSTGIPAKKVLIEEFTNVKCGLDPDAYTRLTYLTAIDTNVIVTSVHINDNLSNTSGTNLTNSITNSFPTAAIDRYSYGGKVAIGSNDWISAVTQRQNMNVPASVRVTNVSYNVAARQLSATVSADFAGDVKGDYRLNLYVKENNVYGPINDAGDNGWNQYSSLYNIQASPFYQVGNYLNGTNYILGPNQYSHNYVVDEFVDGPYGAAGIIPVNGGTRGQTYSKAYTYTLPFTFAGEFRYNPDNVYLVGVLVEKGFSSSVILNAKEVKLTSNPEMPVGIKEASQEDVSLNVYPNPATSYCYVSYTKGYDGPVKIDVYNTLGELVYTHCENAVKGNSNRQINCSGFSEGNYHIVVSFNEHSFSKKLTVIK